MDSGDVSFQQYASELRRAYWLNLIEQQANGNLSTGLELMSAMSQPAQKSQYAQK